MLGLTDVLARLLFGNIFGGIIRREFVFWGGSLGWCGLGVFGDYSCSMGGDSRLLRLAVFVFSLF